MAEKLKRKPGKKVKAGKVKRRKRDYKKEYREYHALPEQKKHRAERNKARRVMGLKKGDPREVDHVRPVEKGGSNSRGNLRIVSRTTNRRKGNSTKLRKKGTH